MEDSVCFTEIPKNRLYDYIDSLDDYDLLKCILSLTVDADRLNEKTETFVQIFDDLAGFMTAPISKLRREMHLSIDTIITLRIITSISKRMSRARVINRDLIYNSSSLVDYCRTLSLSTDVHQFHVFYLNRDNHLILDEAQDRGTVDAAPLYPREVMKRALEVGSSSIILVHNQPDDCERTCASDSELTSIVSTAANSLGIRLLDHLVVSPARVWSLQQLGYL